MFVGEVVFSEMVCREHFRLRLKVPGFPPSRPGQFVQVLCRDAGWPETPDALRDWQTLEAPPHLHRPEAVERAAFLRRPYSIGGRTDDTDGAQITLLHRVTGPGTAWLSRLEAGQKVDLLGPLGNNAFTLPEPGGIALLVGGGVGIPPMLYLAEEIARHNAAFEEAAVEQAGDDASAGRLRAIAFAGATSRDLLALTVTNDAPPPHKQQIDPLYNVEEFARHGIPAVLSTDDGSYGYSGRVTEPLAAYLDKWFADTWDVGSKRPVIYTCGAEPMMKAVAEVARIRGLKCQVAAERAMACGMGTCQSCVIRQRDPIAAEGWRYKLACTDGPVFEAGDLLW